MTAVFAPTRGDLGRLDSIDLMGVELDVVTLAGAVDHIATLAHAGIGGWVITPNLDILRRMVREPEFARLARGATLRLADGTTLVWASRLKRTPLPERAAGSDLIWSLMDRCAKDGLRVYFLGGNPGAAEKAAEVLAQRSPGLIVAGIECPPFGFENDAEYMRGMIDRLVASRPGLVLVGLGSPKQEKLIAQLRPILPAAWMLGIGITFSFVAGEVKRAPVWMRRLGLEWVHRLCQEPRRLARRYLVDGPPFGLRLLGVSAAQGFVRYFKADPIPEDLFDGRPGPVRRGRSARGTGTEARSDHVSPV